MTIISLFLSSNSFCLSVLSSRQLSFFFFFSSFQTTNRKCVTSLQKQDFQQSCGWRTFCVERCKVDALSPRKVAVEFSASDANVRQDRMRQECWGGRVNVARACFGSGNTWATVADYIKPNVTFEKSSVSTIISQWAHKNQSKMKVRNLERHLSLPLPWEKTWKLFFERAKLEKKHLVQFFLISRVEKKLQVPFEPLRQLFKQLFQNSTSSLFIIKKANTFSIFLSFFQL